MVPLVVIALILGFANIFIDISSLFTRDITVAQAFPVVVTNILSMFIVIELFKSIVEYFEIKRLKLTTIMDVAIVFMLREIMIAVYAHKLSATEIGLLALTLLVIGITRTLTIVFTPYSENGATERLRRKFGLDKEEAP